MTIRSTAVFLVAIAMTGSVFLRAGQAAKSANTKAETTAEAKAKAAYGAAEKAANEAEAAVAPLRAVMQKADTAYANASRTANAKRQQAIEAKDLAGEPGARELKQAEANVPVAVKALAEATNAKPAADKALGDARAAVLPLQQAYQAAEEAAKRAAAVAKVAFDAAHKLDNEAKRTMSQASALRQAAEEAKDAPDRARQYEQNLRDKAEVAARELANAARAKKAAEAALRNSQKWVATATQRLSRATAQKKRADGALSEVKNEVAAAIAAAPAAAKAAQDAAKLAAEKKLAADRAAAKRQVIADAAAALAQAQDDQRQAKAQINAAAKALADVRRQKKPAARKLAQAEAKKKAAAAALARANKQVAAATAAHRAAQAAAPELARLDAAAQQAAAQAAVKRNAANKARAALAPAQRKFEQAAMRANSTAQELTRAEARKKAAEEALANLQKRIAAAKKSHVADEQAAKTAEAAAAPLKAEADKTRSAYAAAMQIADGKRALVQQAKDQWYRLVAGKEVVKLMESPDPVKPANRIDEIVFAKLKALGIKPVLCSDAVFVRRAYLDVTGTLPSAQEAKAFIQSPDKSKRVALIDRLLDQPAHVDYWAMKWSDILRIKAEFPVKVWPNGAQAYYHWVWEAVAQNMPYDRFARELLTSSGSNFRVGQVNFYRAIQDRTPEGIAAAVGLALMGTRVALWPKDRRTAMAVFFSQLGYKPTSEWKEQIVFWDPLHETALPGNTAPGVDSVAQAVTVTNQIPQGLAKPLSENGPLSAVFPDGAKTTIPPNRDPREVFADWLIRPKNPWFAKAAVNRTWAWIMGRGIIQEPDDIRPNNPPSNPELLAYLEKELVAGHYNLKHLRRLIFTSTTYQLSPIPRSERADAAANFASYQLQRVGAEVLNDAINQITGSTDLYTSAVPEPFTYIPKNMNAVELADGSISSSFLTLFGRSARATGMENERVNELVSRQWLYMLNSSQVQNKLQSGPKLAAIISSGKPQEIAERLYLTILSRFPTDADVKAVEEYAKSGVSRGRNLWIDLAWALMNSPEFLLRH